MLGEGCQEAIPLNLQKSKHSRLCLRAAADFQRSPYLPRYVGAVSSMYVDYHAYIYVASCIYIALHTYIPVDRERSDVALCAEKPRPPPAFPQSPPLPPNLPIYFISYCYAVPCGCWCCNRDCIYRMNMFVCISIIVPFGPFHGLLIGSLDLLT